MKKLSAADLKLTNDSNYLTDDFYLALLHDRDALANNGPCTDTGLVLECTALLNYEARLLDQKRYREWLDLYTRDAIYWVPYDDQADVRTHVNLVFDDRRRLEDRILRLTSGHAHTMTPPRNFQHVISNVEAWDMPDGRRRVLASQTTYEHRHGHEITRHIYRTDHTLRKSGQLWEIAVKRCVLLNLNSAMEPPTLL